MKQYTKKECEDLLETAFKNLEEFKNETLNSLKATLDNLPDKYKKENSYKEYLHSKDLITSFVNQKYQKNKLIPIKVF